MTGAPALQRPVEITAFGMTDAGRRRADNQDALLMLDLSRNQDEDGRVPASRPSGAAEARLERFALGTHGAIFLVADGMGGAAAGAVASGMAVSEVERAVLAAPMPLRDLPSRRDLFADRLRWALEAANAEIHARSQRDAECRGMGSTATLAGVIDDVLYCAQVGDSRMYLVRQGVAVQLTRDQSYVQALVDAGRMTEEEAERSQHSNKILQALGVAPTTVPVVTHQQLRRRDLLLVCSDGLTRVVRKDEIGAAVERIRNPETLCRELVELANARGGPDNVTIIAARLDGEGLAEPRPGELVAHTPYTPSIPA